MAGMGIQRIFNQFPHRVDRAFDDLTGGDTRHSGGRKGLYCHGRTSEPEAEAKIPIPDSELAA